MYYTSFGFVLVAVPLSCLVGKFSENGDGEKGWERTGIFASNNRDLSSTRYPS